MSSRSAAIRLTDVSKPCCIERIPGTERGAPRVLVSNIGDGTLQLVEVSPNGKLIMFDCIYGKGLVRIETVHPDGSHLRTLVDQRNLNGCPSFAPNGKRVLYITFRKHNSDRTSIVSQKLSGGAPTKLRTGPGSHQEFDCPEYSPAGDQIVVQAGDFSSPEGGYFFNVYTMTADGSNLTALTPDGKSSSPDWGPAVDK